MIYIDTEKLRSGNYEIRVYTEGKLTTFYVESELLLGFPQFIKDKYEGDIFIDPRGHGKAIADSFDSNNISHMTLDLSCVYFHIN